MSVPWEAWATAMGIVIGLQAWAVRIVWGAAVMVTSIKTEMTGLRQDWKEHAAEDERRFDEHAHRLTALEGALSALSADLVKETHARELAAAKAVTARAEVNGELERLRGRTHVLANEIGTDRNFIAAQWGKTLPPVRFPDVERSQAAES